MEKIEAEKFFRQQKRYRLFYILMIAFLYFISAHGVGFRAGAAFSAVPKSFFWLFSNFIPTSDSLAYLSIIISRLVQTILMAVTATTSGAIFALIAAVIGSREISLNRFTKVIARGMASFFRNVPIVVWAIILLLSFKQNEFTGYLAITFTTFGYMTRSFMETIDEVSGSVIEAMMASGASYLQIIWQGVLPMCLNQLLSWLLFLIENNIRDATLVGILTGTGIGFLFDFYYKKFQYDVVGMITLTVIIAVISLEAISNTVRRMIR